MLLTLLKSTITFFCFVLSEVAKYVVAVCAILKSLYLKLFHGTCVTHLLHNYAMKVKYHFQNVDQLIAKVNSTRVKNKTRHATFALLLACFSRLLQDGKADQMLPYIMQRI